MKNLYLLLMIVAIGLASCAKPVLPPASKPDAELTKGEAELRIEQFELRVQELQNQYNEIAKKAGDTKANLDKVNQDLEDCQSEILRLIGATKEDVDAFRQKLGVIEAKVRQMQKLNDEQLLARQGEVKQLEADLNELRGNKISLIPEFYNKIISLAKDIRGLYREKKITTYTVGTWAENRDCLWNIAGKIDIYADPFMWPKIWQANTDQIRNPDIIHPGQVLQIPVKGPKTSDEIKAERKYWRLKKQAQAEAGAQDGGVK